MYSVLSRIVEVKRGQISTLSDPSPTVPKPGLKKVQATINWNLSNVGLSYESLIDRAWKVM